MPPPPLPPPPPACIDLKGHGWCAEKVSEGCKADYARQHWESNLPWAIEAFVYATDGGPDGHFERNRERARGIHRAFLANFGLAPREVPLLFYRCGPGGPDGGQPFTEATAPEGGCFEEDEGD